LLILADSQADAVATPSRWSLGLLLPEQTNHMLRCVDVVGLQRLTRSVSVDLRHRRVAEEAAHSNRSVAAPVRPRAR
jgi:hypothetical protein